MNKHMPDKIPLKHIVCAMLGILFVYAPLREMSLREPLLFAGNSIVINGILALSVGVICGFQFSDKLRPLAAVIGGLSTCSGSVLYTYFFINNTFSFHIEALEILLFLGTSIGIGVLLYQWALNASGENT
jgi:hypothetical protein